MAEISDEELAELRAAKDERDKLAAGAAAKPEPPAEADEAPEPDHYLHLADGRVVEGGSQATHYTEEGSDQVIPVVAVYPKG